ncbi:MAG: hypothetical protein JSV44_07965 [Candidatus Zixiibacteriota bacterium]|nr:MAG: hypothetical protein JSV44_07965 [candidate division Zixibacteria bacterium]
MDCYFGSYGQESGRKIKRQLVCFAIPEAGISFKAPFSGEKLHTEYASLLTLLEFVELNRKLFEGQRLEIYCDNLELINQINMETECRYEYSELLRKTLDYKDKFSFTIGWIPSESNPATRYLFD